MLTPDERRQVEKVLGTVIMATKHFDGEAAMNAALHMSDVVRPAPLAAAMAVAALDLGRLLEQTAEEIE